MRIPLDRSHLQWYEQTSVEYSQSLIFSFSVQSGGFTTVQNGSTPTTTITPTSNPQVSFKIGILSLQELPNSLQVIRSIDLVSSTLNFTLVGNASDSQANFTTWMYSTVLGNNAWVNFTVSTHKTIT